MILCRRSSQPAADSSISETEAESQCVTTILLITQKRKHTFLLSPALPKLFFLSQVFFLLHSTHAQKSPTHTHFTYNIISYTYLAAFEQYRDRLSSYFYTTTVRLRSCSLLTYLQLQILTHFLFFIITLKIASAVSFHSGSSSYSVFSHTKSSLSNTNRFIVFFSLIFTLVFSQRVYLQEYTRRGSCLMSLSQLSSATFY